MKELTACLRDGFQYITTWSIRIHYVSTDQFRNQWHHCSFHHKLAGTVAPFGGYPTPSSLLSLTLLTYNSSNYIFRKIRGEVLFMSTHFPYFSVGTIPLYINKTPPFFFQVSEEAGRPWMRHCVATEKSHKYLHNKFLSHKDRNKVQNTIKVNQFMYAVHLAALRHSGITRFAFSGSTP